MRDIKPSVVEWCAKVFEGMQWCIAGGAVRDMLLNVPPKDYDVFVIGPEASADAVKARTLIGSKDVANGKPSSPHMVRACEVDGETVQVMAMEACPDIDALLDGFDWQLCRFARSSSGVLFTPGVLPRAGDHMHLHRVTFPMSTLLRGVRFAARYDMAFPATAARDLVIAMVDEEARNNAEADRKQAEEASSRG